MKWLVPVKIVEHGRKVLVEASTKAEALRLVRKRLWLECYDATYYDVTIAGPVKRDTEDGEP
jgi:hypothetical protein